MNTIHYYNAEDYASSVQFGQALCTMLKEQLTQNQPLIFLCIGSDRATGDSLGPIIGYKLEQSSFGNYFVYGTLEAPVHAKNLATVVQTIHRRHKNPYIIAIDASLGKQAHVGYYTLGIGSLKPGAGVGKDLIAVGDVFITGIVNLAGLLDRMLLQTTRLHTVMSLADRIYLGIRYGLGLFFGHNTSFRTGQKDQLYSVRESAGSF
ncbi:MAG: spore protease YyaC [Lachnospiraceae bacterium]|nr:spore protease YyaC [Lachnospiraceae bacterium]